MTSGESIRRSGRPGARKGDRARAERLQAALRENLKRRKAQAEGRSRRPAGEAAASRFRRIRAGQVASE